MTEYGVTDGQIPEVTGKRDLLRMRQKLLAKNTTFHLSRVARIVATCEWLNGAAPRPTDLFHLHSRAT
jgi:hypothetical protein